MYKDNLKKCTCGKFPIVYRGLHPTLNKMVFFVMCDNPKCKTKPATANKETRQHAIKEWNSGLVTNSMF
jgi:hypothetical protein